MPQNTPYAQIYERGTNPNYGKPEANATNKTDAAKAACEASGGKWDGKKCIRAKEVLSNTQLQNIKANSPPLQTGVPSPNPPVPEVFRNEQGNPSGITLPDGRTFLGLGPQDVNKIAGAELAKTQLPEGTQPVGTNAGQLERAQRIQQLRQQGGLSEQELMAIQEAPIDFGQALTAGLANVLPSTIGGAVGGAAIGAVGTAGVLSTPLAVAGGIGGFITGFFLGVRNNIKSQQSGEIGAAEDVLTAARSNLRQIRMIAQADPSRAEEALELYQQQINQVYRARRKVQVETQGVLNKFMEDGTDILSDFDLFLEDGGYADLQRQRLEQAIISGAPATPEQLLLELQQDTELIE